MKRRKGERKGGWEGEREGGKKEGWERGGKDGTMEPHREIIQ